MSLEALHTRKSGTYKNTSLEYTTERLSLCSVRTRGDLAMTHHDLQVTAEGHGRWLIFDLQDGLTPGDCVDV